MRVLSGIQPTGELHIGNYLGAVRTWAEQIRGGKDDLFLFIADAHAITGSHDPATLRANTATLARDLMACGIDPDRCTFFVQSDIQEHTELAWYLSSVTPMGDLNRMTQFKEKSEGREFVSLALYSYPVLQSADILLYRTEVVPVGEDQVQHLELARETVRRFNHRFGPIFVEPQPRLSTASRIRGLDGEAKMSKSKGNTIGLFEASDAFWGKLKTAFTDPQRLRKTDPGRPEVCNIFTMHKTMTEPDKVSELHTACTSATIGCMDCKKVLFESFEAELVPLRRKRAELTSDQVKRALERGAEQARSVAKDTMREVRQVMGLGSLDLGPASGSP